MTEQTPTPSTAPITATARPVLGSRSEHSSGAAPAHPLPLVRHHREGGEERPRLLDLFCGAGGAAKGYADAGFEVIGMDINPQPNYPYRFIQGDASRLEWFEAGGCVAIDGIHICHVMAIHASPVCHDFSSLSSVSGKDGTAELLYLTLDTLRSWTAGGCPIPWIVENVEGAPLAYQSDLFGSHGVMLCGTMFGLRVLRHRLFEASFPIHAPPHPRHDGGTYYSPAGHGNPNWRQRDENPDLSGPGYADRCREAMGIPWMNRDELAQAIPPAYTAYLGEQLLAAVSGGVAA